MTQYHDGMELGDWQRGAQDAARFDIGLSKVSLQEAPLPSTWDIAKQNFADSHRAQNIAAAAQNLNTTFDEVNDKIKTATGVGDLFNPMLSEASPFMPVKMPDGKLPVMPSGDLFEAWKNRVRELKDKHPEALNWDEIIDEPERRAWALMKDTRERTNNMSQRLGMIEPGQIPYIGNIPFIGGTAALGANMMTSPIAAMAQFAGGMAGTITSPIDTAVNLFAGAAGSQAKSLISNALKNAAINAAAQAPLSAVKQYDYEKAGLPTGFRVWMSEVEGAAAAGFILDAGMRAPVRAARKAMGAKDLGGVFLDAVPRADVPDRPAAMAPIESKVFEAAATGDLKATREILEKTGALEDPAIRGALEHMETGAKMDAAMMARLKEMGVAESEGFRILSNLLDGGYARAPDRLAADIDAMRNPPQPMIPQADVDRVLAVSRAALDQIRADIPQIVEQAVEARIPEVETIVRSAVQGLKDKAAPDVIAKQVADEVKTLLADPAVAQRVADTVRITSGAASAPEMAALVRRTPELRRLLNPEIDRPKQALALASLDEASFARVMSGEIPAPFAAHVADTIPPKHHARVLDDVARAKPESLEDLRQLLNELPPRDEAEPVLKSGASGIDDPNGPKAKAQLEAMKVDQAQAIEEATAALKEREKLSSKVEDLKGEIAKIEQKGGEISEADAMALAKARGQLAELEPRLESLKAHTNPDKAAGDAMYRIAMMAYHQRREMDVFNAVSHALALGRRMTPEGTKIDVKQGLVSDDGIVLDATSDTRTGDIALALRAIDPDARMGHEALHTLVTRGLISPDEIAHLAALAREAGTFKNEAKYREAYADRANLERQIEEEAAASYVEAVIRGDVKQAENTVANRIKDFIERLKNLLKGYGFTTRDDIVAAVINGDMARREPVRQWMRENDISAMAVRPDAGVMMAFSGDMDRAIHSAMASSSDGDPNAMTVLSKRDGWWVVTSPAGTLYATQRGNTVAISSADLDSVRFRGRGYGIALYTRVIDEALSQGLTVTSDSMVSKSAQRIYEALQQRGYEVQKNANAYSDGQNLFADKQGLSNAPVFTITDGPVAVRPSPPDPPSPTWLQRVPEVFNRMGEAGGTSSPKTAFTLSGNKRTDGGFDYDINESGKKIGHVRGTILNNGSAYISTISVRDPNRLGYRALRDLREQFRKDFPNVTIFEGVRVSGARNNSQSISVMFALSDSSTGQSMRRDLDALGYYSQALEAARSLKQAKGTPEQMLAQLKSAGVKDAEIEATNLRSFLDGKKSVTRDEIVSHLEGNRVGLREVGRKSPSREDDLRWADTLARDGEARGGDVGQELLDLAEAVRAGHITGKDFQIGIDNAGLMPETAQAVKDAAQRVGITGEPDKWSSYSLDPSNPTYRETVLHLPPKSKPITYEEWLAANSYPDVPEMRANFERYGATDSTSRSIKETQGDFTSGHFPEPNIVGHMMTSMVKHEGKPTYLIDQIQSDWGQKLRDGGVRDEAKIAELEAALKAKYAEHNPKIDAWKAFWETLGDRARGMSGADGWLPNKPENGLASFMQGTENWYNRNSHLLTDEMKAEFKRRVMDIEYARRDLQMPEAELATAKAAVSGNPLVNTTDQWVNTTLRRALRQAAEADAEYIAIPSGDTVLSYNPGDEGGMRGFYGSRESEGIVPKNLRKLLTKIDPSIKPVRADQVETPSKGMAGSGFTIFPITDKVKQEVMQRGQVMFAFAGENAATANRELLARAKQMESEGWARHDIWLETGWFRDPGNNWRYEISDKRAVDLGASSFEILRQKAENQSGPLENYFFHEELFQAYPQLRKLMVERGGLRGNQVAAYIRRDTGLRGLITSLMGESKDARIQISAKADRNSFLHEVQHAIDDIEGAFKNVDRKDPYQEGGYANASFEKSARAVEARSDLTDRQRSARPPWLDWARSPGRRIKPELKPFVPGDEQQQPKKPVTPDEPLTAGLRHNQGPDLSIEDIEYMIDDSYQRAADAFGEDNKNASRILGQAVSGGFQRLNDFRQLRAELDRIKATPEQRAAAIDLFLKDQDRMRFEQRTGQSVMFAFAGERARTADLEALAKAKKMEAEGLDRKVIWTNTGWFRGVDGKWRFEIDDSGLSLDWNRSLGKAAEHEKLFDAYPTAQDSWIYRVPMDNGTDGLIVSLPTGRSVIRISDKAKNERSTASHEYQHHVQNAEGFPGGVNVDNIPPDEIARFMKSTGDDVWDRAMAALRAYEASAGEVEARAVQKRLDYTPDQRKSIPPWEDYDVPEDQQIVRFADGSSVSQLSYSSEPPVEGFPTVKGNIMFAIRAFHGSPHDFDRFDMSKIGTGEGAQAYGHGLYFADSEDVARHYRDALKDRGATKERVQELVPGLNPLQMTALRKLAIQGATPDETVKAMQAQFPSLSDDAIAAKIRDAANSFQGRLYEVRINASPDDFLDWDKPLSQQSEKVKGAFRSIQGDRYNFLDERDPYNARDALEKIGSSRLRPGQQPREMMNEASAALRQAGIPGIKYLDQGSRSQGEGSRNYVVFDDNLIEIVAKDGKPIEKAERQSVIDGMMGKKDGADGSGPMFAIANDNPTPPQKPLAEDYAVIDRLQQMNRLIEACR